MRLLPKKLSSRLITCCCLFFTRAFFPSDRVPWPFAAESGALKVGDLVLKVDGIETQGKSVQQVSGMFLGQEFTT